MKLYSFKIYDNETLVKDFIPCYCVKSVKDVNGKTCPPNTLGLYDIVNNDFYTNQGSGDFGMEKTHEFGNILPDDLDRVQYIESTGEQYIDTGISAKQHSNVIVEIDGNSCKITENNTIIRNFIPCLDADGNACMYDSVSKQCFYNKETVPFIFGQ